MTQKDLEESKDGYSFSDNKLNKSLAIATKEQDESQEFISAAASANEKVMDEAYWKKEEEGISNPFEIIMPVASDIVDFDNAVGSAVAGDWEDAVWSAAAAIPLVGTPIVKALKPKKTVKAYKLFRTDPNKPGELFPLFVNAKQSVKQGEWVDAEIGPSSGKKVKSKIGDLAMRPGWHSGDLPVATHIGGKTSKDLSAPDYRPDNQVWAEVEMPDDVDWQSIATSRADKKKNGDIIARTAHITDQLPTGGHYRYKTNSNMTGNWLIGGSMKVNKVLSDAEVKKINDAAGVSDLPRIVSKEPEFNQGGLVDAEMETLNFNHGGDVGEHPKTMAQEDRIEYVELGDNETLKSASLRVGIPQNQLLKWNMTATDEQRKQKRLYIPNSYYEAGGISNPKKITPESLTAKLNPKRSAYFEALKNKQAGVGTQVKEKASEVGSALKGIVTQATNVGTDKGFFEQLGDKLSDVYSALTVDTSTYDDEMRDLNLVEEPKEEVVIPSKSEATKDTTPSFEEGLFDWFSRSEGTVTATVNGVVTYPYGVEEGKFQGIDREAYKNEDGTYKDREFAIAVWGKHKIKLKENHPQWDSYPLGVREALSSYKWNYGLGNNVVSYAVAAAKEKDPVKQKALFKKSMTAMLDTFGATDKAKGEEVKGAMTGLVARRANDYNRAAKDLGYPEIATYSLSNQKDGTGAVAVYKDKDGMVISTQKSSYKIHTDSKAVTGRKINKSIASVDLTNWSQAIT